MLDDRPWRGVAVRGKSGAVEWLLRLPEASARDAPNGEASAALEGPESAAGAVSEGADAWCTS
jgi:hypothetical protein